MWMISVLHLLVDKSKRQSHIQASTQAFSKMRYLIVAIQFLSWKLGKVMGFFAVNKHKYSMEVFLQ